MSSDELRKRLREVGYSEEAIKEILGFYEQGDSQQITYASLPHGIAVGKNACIFCYSCTSRARKNRYRYPISAQVDPGISRADILRTGGILAVFLLRVIFARKLFVNSNSGYGIHVMKGMKRL
jgi:hypothetical protein